MVVVWIDSEVVYVCILYFACFCYAFKMGKKVKCEKKLHIVARQTTISKYTISKYGTVVSIAQFICDANFKLGLLGALSPISNNYIK